MVYKPEYFCRTVHHHFQHQIRLKLSSCISPYIKLKLIRRHQYGFNYLLGCIPSNVSKALEITVTASQRYDCHHWRKKQRKRENVSRASAAQRIWLLAAASGPRSLVHFKVRLLFKNDFSQKRVTELNWERNLKGSVTLCTVHTGVFRIISLWALSSVATAVVARDTDATALVYFIRVISHWFNKETDNRGLKMSNVKSHIAGQTGSNLVWFTAYCRLTCKVTKPSLGFVCSLEPDKSERDHTTTTNHVCRLSVCS